MIVVSHLPALWMLFNIPGKREIREAALSPEDDEQSRAQVPNLQLVQDNTSERASNAQSGGDAETLTARLSLLYGNEASVHKPALSWTRGGSL